jgi:purine catabolism regulator
MDNSRELTIADLVATASLDSRFLAGQQGGDRRVLWAHSCEMPNPEEWLGPHELLMTVGLCVPKGPEAQVTFVNRLNDAGLAGIMIGDHTLAPPITEAMLAEANRCGFPVVLTAAQVPYAVVARHVAAANSHEQTLQVLLLSKLYHNAAYAGDDAEALVESLANLLRIEISISDVATGQTLLRSAAIGDDTTTSTHHYEIHGAHDALLTIKEFTGEAIDGFILIHLMKVLEVVIDRILNAAERRAEISARLMLSLLNGVGLPDTGEFLAPQRASDGFVLVALPVNDARSIASVLAVSGLPVIAGVGRVSYLVLVPTAVIPETRELLASVSAHAGVSSVFTDFSDARVAAVEAGKVLTAAQHSDRFWTEFNGSTVSVLTRSHREAQEIVRGVLGPLADDTPRATMLRETLFTFLRHDRKWKDASEELFIHKQTLSYRLGKIEQETGLTLSRSADLSSLWIAYQAWESLSPIESR